MKRYAAAVALVLCLMLGACGGPAEDGTGVPAGRLAAAAGLEEEQLLLTIGGREVPAWRYLYWLAYTCQQVGERYQANGLTLDWDAPVSGGTLADYVKEQALADTALYAAVETWAETYGCTVPEEDTGTALPLPELGLTAAQMAELDRVGRLYGALYELACTEGSPLAATAEELARYGESAGAVTVEQLPVPFGEDREAARSRAAELFAQINSAEDQAAVFSTLTAEHGGGTRTLTEDTEAPELLAAAQTLEEGQCSGILETEDGFVILRRLPLEPEGFRGACFDARLQAAAENSTVTVTPEYTQLDPAAFAVALDADGASGT